MCMFTQQNWIHRYKKATWISGLFHSSTTIVINMILLDNDTNSRQFWSFYIRCVCIWCMLRMCFSYCSTCNDWKPLEFNYVLEANKKRRSKLYENQILQVKLVFKIGRKQPPVTLLCSHDSNNNWWYITIYCNNYIESRPPFTDMHIYTMILQPTYTKGWQNFAL